MQINKQTPVAPVQAATPAQVLWTTIGAAWEKLDKKGRRMVTLQLGSTRNPFPSITFSAGDKLFLRANVKRPGKTTDPDFQICVAD